MAQIEIVLLTTIISLVLFLGGFYLKKKFVFISLSGAILLLITGLLLLVNEPVTFKSGKIIETNSTSINNITTTTETITYSSQDNTLNNILSWVLLLLGFSGSIGCSLVIWNQKFEEE